MVPADITEEGSLVLSARLFGDIIRRLPDDVVTVATQDYMVNITCGMSEFNILGTDAGEFPELPIVEYQNSLILPQRVLHSMITETIFAVSTNDSRPIHTGELFERTADGCSPWWLWTATGWRCAGRGPRWGLPTPPVNLSSPPAP